MRGAESFRIWTRYGDGALGAAALLGLVFDAPESLEVPGSAAARGNESGPSRCRCRA